MSQHGPPRARNNRALDDSGSNPSHEALLDEANFDEDQRKWYEAPDRWYWTRKSHDKAHPWHLVAVPYNSTGFAAPGSQGTRTAWNEVYMRWRHEQIHELQYQKALTAIPKPNPPLWQMHELDGDVVELRMSYRNSWTFVQNFPIMCPLDRILTLWLGIHNGRLTFERAFTKMVLSAPVSTFAHASSEKDVTESMPTALGWFPEAYRLFRILYNVEYLDHIREFGSHKALVEHIASFDFTRRTAQLRQVRQKIEASRQMPVCALEEAIEPHLVDLILATHKRERYRRESYAATSSTVSHTSEKAPENPGPASNSRPQTAASAHEHPRAPRRSHEEPSVRASREEDRDDHRYESDDPDLTALPPIPPHVRDELAAERFRPSTRTSSDAGSTRSLFTRARNALGSRSSRKSGA